MTGSPPYSPGFGAPPPGGGRPSPPTGPGYMPQPPANFGPSTPPKRERTSLLASGVVLAVMLGVAALVLSIIGLTRSPEPPPPLAAPQADKQELFVDDADKPLCEAIAPLMREESDRTNALLDKGGDTPERLAAIPGYKSDTAEWAKRIQSVLNEHADPPRYLTRTLQQYMSGVCL